MMSLPSQNAVITTCPSVAGVDDARVFFSLMCALEAEMLRAQSVLPVTASRLKSSRALPSLVVDCTNSRLPQTMGEEFPGPGIGTFHRMPFFSSNWSGMSLALATPVPFGPRKRGQLSASIGEQMRTKTTSMQNRTTFLQGIVFPLLRKRQVYGEKLIIPNLVTGSSGKPVPRPTILARKDAFLRISPHPVYPRSVLKRKS